MGKYDPDLAKYILGLMDLAIQGMLDDIDTRVKVANPSYKDKEQLSQRQYSPWEVYNILINCYNTNQLML